MNNDDWMCIKCWFIVSEARANELKLMKEFNRNYGKLYRVGTLFWGYRGIDKLKM